VVKPKRYSRSDDETTDGEVRDIGKISRFLDNLYGIGRDVDTLMIGNNIVNVEESGDITINGKRFNGTKGIVAAIDT
jgi:Mg2+/Co2+ transporter CorB